MAILKSSAVVLMAAGLGLAGCTDPNGNADNTGTGALVGAGVGAVLGRAIGGNGRGAVVGGLIGAGLGAAVGENLDRQEAALRRDLGGSGVSIVNTGDQLIVTLPEAITFPVDSANLKPSFISSLHALANNLQQYPNSRIEIVGHTDSTGNPGYNQRLSERRAGAVSSVLVNAGIQRNRLTVYGQGEGNPIASNATAAGRQQNRRVEIFIIPR